MKIAVLDDYLHLSQQSADWSKLPPVCGVRRRDRKRTKGEGKAIGRLGMNGESADSRDLITPRYDTLRSQRLTRRRQNRLAVRVCDRLSRTLAYTSAFATFVVETDARNMPAKVLEENLGKVPNVASVMAATSPKEGSGVKATV